MEKFFHVSKENLAVNTTLEKGKWGRSTMSVPLGAINCQKKLNVIIEIVFEEVRKEIDNEKTISRFNCVFGCPSLESAKCFRDRYRPHGFIYEIEIEDSTPVFEADFNLITHNQHTIVIIKENAKRYWKGEKTRPFTEVLIDGNAKITKKINV